MTAPKRLIMNCSGASPRASSPVRPSASSGRRSHPRSKLRGLRPQPRKAGSSFVIDPNRLKSRIPSRQIAHVVHQTKKDILPRKAKHKQKVAPETENN